MAGVSTRHWESLEKWSAIAFVMGGLLFLLNTILEGLGRYTTILGEPTFVNFLIYAVALILSLVGMLGFYRLLAERVPRLAQTAALVVGIAGIGFILLILWASITTILNRPDPPGALLILSLGAIVLGIILFTLASLRTHVPSPKVSLLLGTFVVAWILTLILGFVVFGGDAPDWLAVAINGVSAVVMLAIGNNIHGNVEMGGRTGSTTI